MALPVRVAACAGPARPSALNQSRYGCTSTAHDYSLFMRSWEVVCKSACASIMGVGILADLSESSACRYCNYYCDACMFKVIGVETVVQKFLLPC